MRLIIVSGRSGSGKSTALNVLEDNGFYCIDNLPAGLLPELAERALLHTELLHPQVAVSLDARNQPSQLKRFPELLEEVFELNMALDELKSGDQSAVPQLVESRASFQQMLGEIDGELAGQFRRHDDSEAREARRAILEQIRKILNRRRYIRNLVSEVDRQLTAHGA